MTTAETTVAPRVGTSACLLGERTRYDGRLKGEVWVQDVLAAHCRLVAVCPEVEVGMPVPREPIHLVGPAARPRVVGNTSRRDWTAPLRRLVRRRIAELRRLPLAGFVLKSRSPSCGVGGAELEDRRGRIQPRGTGVLALGLQQTLPWLPLIQETELVDSERRLRFLAQVFVLDRVEAGLGARPSAGTLRRVHASERKRLDLVTATVRTDDRGLAALDRRVAAVAGRLSSAQVAAYKIDLLEEIGTVAPTVPTLFLPPALI